MSGIGPVLPPGWQPSANSDSEEERDESVRKIDNSSISESEIPDLPTDLPIESADSSNSNPAVVGPVLPQGLNLARQSSANNNEDNREELSLDSPDFEPNYEISDEEPEEPNHRIVGPVLPPGVTLGSQSDSEGEIEDPKPRKSAKNDEISEQDCYGPALPPDLLDEADIAGNSGMSKSQEEEEVEEDDDDEDDRGIGPSLPPADLDKDYEERLLQFKHQEMLKEMGEQKREEWMTSLPKKLQNYGLGARTFSKRGVESSDTDHSAWTDSPVEKLRKTIINSSEDASSSKSETGALEKRDKELEKRAKEMNKTRSESLVELHMKKREQDAKEAGPMERRPFDRELDLNPSKLSAGGTKKIVERATHLGSRFGHGTSQKYL